MRKQSEAPNDWWFRFIGIPLIAVMSHVIFFNENHGPSDNQFAEWQVLLIAVSEAMILWETNRLVLLFFRKRFPGTEQSGKRILYQALGCLAVTILIRYMTIWLYDKTVFWGYLFPPEGYLYNIFVGLLYVAIVGGIYEGVYYFRKWKQQIAETETLKRQNLQTQLDSLKAQINPHFLFNNLSSLSSLIMEDQHRAVQFVEQLAAVYRYLLQSNEKDLTSLRNELDFIENYFRMLKTRFNDGIELKLNVPDDQLDSLVAPLTLQLLIENAVKHNMVLPGKPLVIELHTIDETLIVENNVQPKSSPIISHRTGLKNIIEKYRILSPKKIVVEQDAHRFRVSIPLLKPEQHESTDRRR